MNLSSADQSDAPWLVSFGCARCILWYFCVLTHGLQCEETWRAQERSYVISGRVRSLRHSRPFASLRGNILMSGLFQIKGKL